MKHFIFTNDDNSFRVEYRTSLDKSSNSSSDFTILQILGLDEHEEKAGIKYQQLPGNNIKEFLDFATTNNLKLVEVDEDGETTLKAIGTAFSITTTSPMAGGNDTVAYDEDLVAEGGSGSYEWELESGALPTGTTLTSAGKIAGTPTEVATFNFTVRVTDTFTQTITKALSIVISA